MIQWALLCEEIEATPRKGTSIHGVFNRTTCGDFPATMPHGQVVAHALRSGDEIEAHFRVTVQSPDGEDIAGATISNEMTPQGGTYLQLPLRGLVLPGPGRYAITFWQGAVPAATLWWDVAGP